MWRNEHFAEHTEILENMIHYYSWLDEMNSYLGTSLTCVLTGHLKSIEIILN